MCRCIRWSVSVCKGCVCVQVCVCVCVCDSECVCVVHFSTWEYSLPHHGNYDIPRQVWGKRRDKSLIIIVYIYMYTLICA